MRPSKQLKDTMSNNGGNSAEWRTVGSNNKGNANGGQGGTNYVENGSSPMQDEAMTLENGENSDRTNATVTNDANAADGMKTYNSKTCFIEVRFTTGNIKGFNVARALTQFLAAAREQYDELTISPYRELTTTCVSALIYQTQKLESSNIFAMK
jgi:hypothetical protein